MEFDPNITYKIIVLVSSHFVHYSKRHRIRHAWGDKTMWITQQPYKVIFVLGNTTDSKYVEQIKKESEKYRDILTEDIEEDYYKLAFKVMIGFQWAYQELKFEFLFKTDDDVFVQMDRIMTRVDTDFSEQNYIGNLMHNQPVERLVLSKEQHPNDLHNDYCSGGGFLMSRKTVGKIIPLFDWDQPLIIDDAYIGRLVIEAGLEAYHVMEGVEETSCKIIFFAVDTVDFL